MNQEQLTKKLGKRILSEANDLKRTVSALANDIDVDKKLMQQIVDGECELKDTYEVHRISSLIVSLDRRVNVITLIPVKNNTGHHS